MNSAEISSALESCPITEKCFLGVYARDQIPPTSYYTKGCFVYNRAPARHLGTHWNVVYVGDCELEHFDSRGESPPNYICQNVPFDKITFNICAVQHPMNTTCGQHCIFSAYLRFLAIAYDTIMNKFYFDDNEKNDAMVSGFLKHHFGF